MHKLQKLQYMYLSIFLLILPFIFLILWEKRKLRQAIHNPTTNTCLTPYNPRSDQEVNSPYCINTLTNRQVVRVRKISMRKYHLIKNQFLKDNFVRNVRLTVRKITFKILGIRGLHCKFSIRKKVKINQP